MHGGHRCRGELHRFEHGDDFGAGDFADDDDVEAHPDVDVEQGVQVDAAAEGAGEVVAFAAAGDGFSWYDVAGAVGKFFEVEFAFGFGGADAGVGR